MFLLWLRFMRSEEQRGQLPIIYSQPVGRKNRESPRFFLRGGGPVFPKKFWVFLP
jgi:hypothetical protein